MLASVNPPAKEVLMEQLELPAITTFDDARSAIAAFDERFWKHAPGLPTVRHTMIHLCMTLHRDPSMSPIAISGLARLSTWLGWRTRPLCRRSTSTGGSRV